MKRAVDRNGARLDVGSRVVFQWPSGPVTAEVIEDRGPLGRNGKRILRVRPLFEGFDDLDFALEMPVDELTIVE